MITDLQYYDFLRKLLDDQRGKNPINLSEWEAQFLGSYSMAERQTLWLTGDLKHGRRASVDRMWRKHGPELQFPHPLDAITERPKIPAADSDGCQYLVREDGVQRRCNEAAEFQEPGRLRYCRLHAEAVQKECKRAKIRVSLIAFKAESGQQKCHE